MLQCRCCDSAGGGGGIISCHQSSESGTTLSFESAPGGEGEGDMAKVTWEQFGPGLISTSHCSPRLLLEQTACSGGN